MDELVPAQVVVTAGSEGSCVVDGAGSFGTTGAGVGDGEGTIGAAVITF